MLPRVWRSIGFLRTAVGLFFWTTTVSTHAALFASTSMWATAYAVLPYISWVKLPANEE